MKAPVLFGSMHTRELPFRSSHIQPTLLWALVIVLLSGVIATLTARMSAAQAPKTVLEGKWQLVTFERDGQVFGPPDVSMSFAFAGSALTISGMYGSKAEERCTFTLDGKASPPRIDYVRPNKDSVPGIYSLRGDELKIALPFSGPQPQRPKEFIAPAKSRVAVLTLKRQNK